MRFDNFLFRPQELDRYWLVVGVVVALLFLAIPFVSNRYIVSLGFSILLFGTLAASWNILSGYTGYISFGHAAFFGLGAYAGGLLIVKQGVNPILGILLAGIITFLISLPMATTTLRLDDVQFSIIMLAFAQILLFGAEQFEGITEGVRGLVLPVGSPQLLLYVFILTLAIVTTVTAYLLDRSHVGLALTAIHDDEEAAEAMGVNTLRYKVFAFSLSAFYPGFAGAIAALYWTYINPSTVFNPILSGDMMIMSVLGGMGTVIGPLVGALGLTPLRIEAQAQFPFLHGIVFGSLFLIFVLTMPEGVVRWAEQSQLFHRIR
jgi:branched-chain amino acid transport system permease protein